MFFQFGIDRLLSSPDQVAYLKQCKVGLVAHPASVTNSLSHSLDALLAAGVPISKAFGPQHGMRGDKQDNMIESDDYVDPLHQIPVISLYGEHRRPTPEMVSGLDVILFDLQDVGCRIYTYITTLKYFAEVCATHGIELWVLDRPNPAGRQVDGLMLVAGEESFVGADQLPTRHGLTTGELVHWFASTNHLDVEIKTVQMAGYQPDKHCWPAGIAWVNPSPNAASVNMTHCFPGTVLLEGTNLSEGRGTTIPLEVIGAPDLPISDMLALMSSEAAHWLLGATLRPCFFEPTFHKHVGKMCHGIQIHTDHQQYQPDAFFPYRLIAGLLKSLRLIAPDYEIWRHHDYEYEAGRIPIDVINGGPDLRLWVDDDKQSFSAFEHQLEAARKSWLAERESYLLY